MRAEECTALLGSELGVTLIPSPRLSPVLPGEQMLGSGLALPRSLAAECWRQAGAEETPRDVHEHTHTADLCLSSRQEETEPGEGGMGWHNSLSHTQPPSKHPPGIPPSSHQKLCSNIPSLTLGLCQAHQEQSLRIKPWLSLYTSMRRDHKKGISSG